jgi:Zn-finger nucleic acid-binding protein
VPWRADIKTVEGDQLLCPGCSGRLLVSTAEGFRRYICESCGGTLMTIVALRQLAGTAAQHIWTAPPAASPGTGRAHCPFCRREMQPKAVQTGTAAVCRPCESVWLDKDAAGSLPVKAAANQPTLESEPVPHCEQCGAPLASTDDQNCKYCGAALHAATKVVLLPVAGNYHPAGHRRRGSLLSEILGTVEGPP